LPQLRNVAVQVQLAATCSTSAKQSHGCYDRTTNTGDVLQAILHGDGAPDGCSPISQALAPLKVAQVASFRRPSPLKWIRLHKNGDAYIAN
jgi:hypothetical protein